MAIRVIIEGEQGAGKTLLADAIRKVLTQGIFLKIGKDRLVPVEIIERYPPSDAG